uniref:SCP domain-containing protein n=1 Tax=Strongyloides venezuelensis TaxID=75913 RepID=A0A0K0G220_STRVS
MAYNLVVPYAMIEKTNKQYYSYCGKIYPTKMLMWEKIRKKHSTINSSNILLLNIGTYLKHGPFQKAPQHIYENPLLNFAIKRPSSIVIQEFYIRRKAYYNCLERTFQDYDKAKGYAQLMTLRVKYTFKQRLHPEVPKELNILKKIRYFCFSSRIWLSVWKNCYYYRCFAAHNFKQFKLRLLNELNLYRMRHNANPVIVKNLATKLAEAYLQRILNTGLKFTSQSDLQYYESSPYYFAPLFFKKWYDEGKHYRYGSQIEIRGTEHFTAMIWKAVKYVGIAVKEVNNIVHMYIVFQPKPNGIKLFLSNVEKRKYSFPI